MKEIKTYILISILIDKYVGRSGSWREIVEAIAHICNLSYEHYSSAEGFQLFLTHNKETIAEEILEQHPKLGHVMHEGIELQDELHGVMWKIWADNHIATIGESLTMVPSTKNFQLFVYLGSQVPDLN